VIPSFVNSLPLSRDHYRSYLPLLPLAIRQFDLRRFDLVISFSYAVANGVRIWPGQRHISYTFTPMRYAWRNYKIGRGATPRQSLANWLFRAFRKWDSAAAAHVSQFAAVSLDIAGWIRRVYGRAAQVIYPPVDVERFQPYSPRDRSYITVSRLVAHKRIDLIVEAFARLKLPLTVVGDGPELAHLRRMAPPNITFTGYQPDYVVSHLLGRARGFVCAAEEDFGIAIVEAQAAGCPVIAYGKGGALETVIEGETGLFFQEQSANSVLDAVERFERSADQYNEQELIFHVQQFRRERFMQDFATFAGLLELPGQYGSIPSFTVAGEETR
jgi:glycosyltransferase involved in cell wall biosynthesis